MEKIIIDSDLTWGMDWYESGEIAFSRWPHRINHYSPEAKLIAVFKIKK